jgi:hypothetical protein
MGASPGAAVALTEMNAEVDIRDVLPSIRVPTLVMHRANDSFIKVEHSRYIESKIPGARYVELEGEENMFSIGESDAIVGEIEVMDGDLGGLAVHIASRVMGHAGPNEVLVSGTVKDLVVGSGIEFEERGERELRGVPGEWRLYAVG